VKTLLEMSDSFRVLPHLVALSIAYLLALPIGWNRERAERSAGLRTFPLVALASCGIVQATEGILNGHPEGTARIIEGLMTGMGFIGGGAILKHGGSVRGTATAASLWATGATGAAVGLGAYDVAIVISLFTFLTLWLLVPFKEEGGKEDENNAKPHSEL
jgi:putative Mg2+ transporter-C (MgtC) family protein